jgi:membrane-associated phospholipid phosphatase
MIRRLRAFYNPWFIIPFLTWAFIGAVMLLIFDRRALFSTVNMHHNDLLDIIMAGLTELGNGIGIFIMLISLLIFKSCRNWWYAIAAVVCNVVPAIVIQLLKGIFNAPRPFEYYKADAGWIHFNDAWGEKLLHHSFPSGHSAGIFSLCCFLALIVPPHRSGLGLVLFLLALLVGYTRMYLAAHFFADVYVGSMLGTTTTLFCFALMRRWSNQSFTIVTRASGRSTFR